MNFLFAWRYFKSKKTTNAINIIAWISVLAISVGTAALIIILSVFNGFEDLVKNLYGDFYADLKISPAHGNYMQIDAAQLQKIKAVKGVGQLSFVAEQKAVLANGDYQAIVSLKGVDSNYSNVNKVSGHVMQGKYDLGSVDTPMIIVGVGIEDAVGIVPQKDGNTQVTLYFPNTDAKSFTSSDAMNSYNVMVSAAFSVQEEYDNKYAFTNIGFVRYMLNLKNDECSSIEVSTKNGNDASVKNALQQALGNNFLVQTRFEQNQSLFTVMEIERWIIYIILSLILLIASFNMIGALTMLVLEKQKDIAVLKAMGANDSLILRIFLTEGFVLAGIGGISGILLALIICELQIHFHLVPLQGDSFILNYYPVQLRLPDFILVSATVLVVATLASWIPSRKAAGQFFSLKS